MGTQADAKHTCSVGRRARNRYTRLIFCFWMAVVCLGWTSFLSAQAPENEPAANDGETVEPAPAEPAPVEEAPPPRRFYEQDPYDVLVLNKANDDARLKIMPLNLPDQRMPPESKRVGKISVFLLEAPEDEYEVFWRDIDHIEFFGDLVLAEAGKVVLDAFRAGSTGDQSQAQQGFDEAFDYYQYLRRHYPKTAGLDEAIQTYLYVNAGTLFRGNRVAEAVAVLEELYRLNPAYRHSSGHTVLKALDQLGARLIQNYIDAKDYRSARVLLERYSREYKGNLAGILQLETQLVGIATKRRDEAAAHLKAERFQQAYDVIREVLKIWPTLDGCRELAVEISRQYPLGIVGVSQPALNCDPTSLDNAAARRCGVLRYATLMQYVDRGTDGGRYRCPFGQAEQSDDRTELIFRLRSTADSPTFTGYDLSRLLIELADPSSANYRASWASLMDRIEVEDVMDLRIHLQRPHVLPQAMLQIPLNDSNVDNAIQYTIADQQEDQSRFLPTTVAADPDQKWPVILERYYSDPRAAIRDVRDGKIDVLDHVLPADALRLQQDESLQVGTYAFPSIHVLVPNSDNPYLENRHFRRALVLAINREVILNKGLLNGNPLEGCRVLSAGLMAGMTSDDPAGYAYDYDVEPYPYDPVLASILKSLAEQQLAAIAEKKEEPVPEFKPLVLAHPATELARFVCGQIQTQLELVGIECSLLELPPGKTSDPEMTYDLLYLQFTMREPLVDAESIYGPNGAIPSTSPYVRLALRQLAHAKNWPEARDHLHELHRLICSDVTAIPLWQLVDHYVHRKGMQGLRNNAVFLYENVDQWRLLPPEWKE